MNFLAWLLQALDLTFPRKESITILDGTVTAHIYNHGPWWNVNISQTGWPATFIGGFPDKDEALAEVERFIREDVPNRDRIMCERSWAL